MKVRLMLQLFPVVLLISLSFLYSAAAGETENRAGFRIYQKKCVWCHGSDGRGDGPASAFLRPRPRDFTSGVFRFTSSDIGKGIYRAISEGLPGTAMPAWKSVLNTAEIRELVKVVRAFSEGSERGEKSAGAPPETPVPFSGRSVRKGEEVFNRALCYECHGKRGRGDGTRKLKDDRGDRVWPRDLTRPESFKGGSAPIDIFNRVTNGIPGTPMPGFGKKKLLTADERWDLVNYVLSLLADAPEERYGETVVSRFIPGNLPRKPGDPEWRRLDGTTLPLSPNIVSGERLFKPTNEFLNVKSLYNRTGITFLLSWRDRTKSLPAGTASELLAEGQPFEDGVAIQFPKKAGSTRIRPNLGHGDASLPVRTIYWGAGQPEAVKIFNGAGFRHQLRAEDSLSVTAGSTYSDGEWSVVIYLKYTGGTGENFSGSVKGVPVAFANWDGSNAERGSRHTFTAWYPLVYEKKGDKIPFFFAAGFFIVFIVLQKLIAVKSQLSQNETPVSL